MLSFLTATVLATTFSSIVSAAPLVSRASGRKSQIVTYYGQSADQGVLDLYCNDPNIDIIPIAFVNGFPYQNDNGPYPSANFGDQCGGVANGTNLFSDCWQIRKYIPTCQGKGKKILISIGGDAQSGYSLAGDDAGIYFANIMWKIFGPPDSSYTGPRPFGSMIVDGFDFDIEGGGGSGYGAMANQLRSLMDAYKPGMLLTAAPQCIVPDGNLADAIKKARFDHLYIQFYNTPFCSARTGVNYANNGNTGDDMTFGSWVNWVQSNVIPNNWPQLFIGLAAGPNAVVQADQYLNAHDAKILLTRFFNHPMFGGVMLWDAGNARLNPDGNYVTTINSILVELNGGVTTTSTTISSTTSSSTTSSSTSSVVTTTSSQVSSTTSSVTTTSSSIIPSTTTSSTSSLSTTVSSSASSSTSSSTLSTTTRSPFSSVSTTTVTSTTSIPVTTTMTTHTSGITISTSSSSFSFPTSGIPSFSFPSSVSFPSSGSSLPFNPSSTISTTSTRPTFGSTTLTSDVSTISTSSARPPYGNGTYTGPTFSTTISTPDVSSTTSYGLPTTTQTTQSGKPSSSTSGISNHWGQWPIDSTSKPVDPTTSDTNTWGAWPTTSSKPADPTSSGKNTWGAWPTTSSKPSDPTTSTFKHTWPDWSSTSKSADPTTSSSVYGWSAWPGTSSKTSSTTTKPADPKTSAWGSWPSSVYVTTTTTVYTDVCPTGFTKVTGTITATVTVTDPAKQPTGKNFAWPTGSAGIPAGFYVSSAVCSVGCADGPVTVSVTVPIPSIITMTVVPTPATPAAETKGSATWSEWSSSTPVAATGKVPSSGVGDPVNPSPVAATGRVPDASSKTPDALATGNPIGGYGDSPIKVFTGGAAVDQAPATAFSVAVCVVLAVVGLVL